MYCEVLYTYEECYQQQKQQNISRQLNDALESAGWD